MSKNKLWRLLALLAAFGLIAAACGGGDDEEADASDGDDTAESTDADDTESTDADDADDVDDANDADDADDTDMADADETASGTVEAAPTCEGESDGVLRIGGILPETGNLAFLGPPEFAGAELAVQEINDAGGVLDKDVEWSPGDSGDNGDVANQTVDRLLGEDVDAFLGAASSGVSFTVIDKITGACKIHFSPANTSPDFTTKDPNELYFRTAPSDVLQGRVLADLIVEEGAGTVALMALQDPYGEGLLKFTSEPLEEQGVAVVESFVYDPKAPSFDAEVEKMVSAGADAHVIIGFDETAQILTGLFEAGVSADSIYLVDGNIGNALGEKFSEAGILSGIKGTLPAAEISGDFKDRLLSVDADLVDFSYGPETYDAVVILALAAEAAESDDPAAIAKRINGVTGGGEKCTSFSECKEMLAAGTDIDYDGPSGPQDFSQAGEPTEASFAILNYAADTNTIDDSQTIYKFAKIGS